MLTGCIAAGDRSTHRRGGWPVTGNVAGTVSPGFEPVREVFRESFSTGNELGAAVAAYHQGEKVVDLWGGYRDADRTRPWTEDTLVLVFSTTKGLAAAAMAHAHSRGLLQYDDPVSEYWPQFGQAGKGDVTVRELLAHRAGVAALGRNLTPGDVADRESLVARLAAKEPDWDPGTRHGYHAWSLGWYESELLRRVDPAGRRLPAYVSEEILPPLDGEFYIGLPDAVSRARVAEIVAFSPLDMLRNVGSFPSRMLVSMANPWSTSSRALNPFAMQTPAALDSPAWRSLPIPAGNGIGTVRTLAKLYGDLAIGGPTLGITEGTYRELAAPRTVPPGGPRDVVLKTETAYSLGFWKPFSDFKFGSRRAFGAPGAGGSFAFADPARELGFAYAPNRMGAHIWDDPRERVLREAVLRCLD